MGFTMTNVICTWCHLTSSVSIICGLFKKL